MHTYQQIEEKCFRKCLKEPISNWNQITGCKVSVKMLHLEAISPPGYSLISELILLHNFNKIK